MAEYEPVNELERRMLAALSVGDQAAYLRLLSEAELTLPVVTAGRGRGWATVTAQGRTFVAAYTSYEAMRAADADGALLAGRPVSLAELAAQWPDPGWSLVVDAGLDLAAHLPASLVRQIAAGEFGDRDPADDTGPAAGREPVPDAPAPAGADPWREGADPWRPGTVETILPAGPRGGADDEADVPTVMQKAVPPEQVPYYLDMGYDWVAGYVHRWRDVADLATVPDIVATLGLGYPGSPFSAYDRSLYLLRWTAYRSELYHPVPLATSEAGPAAEVPSGPALASGLAVTEYRVDSIRLPHQAEMWRIGADGAHHFVAVYDADEQRWLVNRDLLEDG